jgi:hypothetical protein
VEVPEEGGRNRRLSGKSLVFTRSVYVVNRISVIGHCLSTLIYAGSVGTEVFYEVSIVAKVILYAELLTENVSSL